MCGRYVLFSKAEDIFREFGIQEGDPTFFEPHYNISPGMHAPVVVESREKKTILSSLRWGLVPHWAKDSNIGYKMINARAETLAEKPSFKKPFSGRRCIIPANGFYEWRKLGDKKIPFYIRVNEQEVAGFAGLYEKWKAPDNTILPTFTIITTSANMLIEPLHDRMPVILHKSDYQRWLDGENQDKEELQAMLQPFPTERMSVYRVSDAVNKSGTNDPQFIEPVNV